MVKKRKFIRPINARIMGEIDNLMALLGRDRSNLKYLTYMARRGCARMISHETATATLDSVFTDPLSADDEKLMLESGWQIAHNGGGIPRPETRCLILHVPWKTEWGDTMQIFTNSEHTVIRFTGYSV